MARKLSAETRAKNSLRATEWNKHNTRGYSIKFNIDADADIIAQLENSTNVQGYLKRLIRRDIAENRQ